MHKIIINILKINNLFVFYFFSNLIKILVICQQYHTRLLFNYILDIKSLKNQILLQNFDYQVISKYPALQPREIY
jgi:hypothetical protein